MKPLILSSPKADSQSFRHSMRVISTGFQWCGIAALGLTAGAVTNSLAGSTIIEEKSLIRLDTAVGIAMTLIPAAMWLSRKLTLLSDQMDALRHQITELPCKAKRSEICPERNDPS